MVSIALSEQLMIEYTITNIIRTLWADDDEEEILAQ